jgi:uncharacterized protein (DUF362 family)
MEGEYFMDSFARDQSAKIHGDFLESIWADFYQLFTMGLEEREARLMGFDITPKELEKALIYLKNEKPSSDTVALVKCSSYDTDELKKALFRSIDLLQAEERIFSCKNILIKPNCIEARYPDQYTTTHPAFLQGLIDVLRNFTDSNIIIGEGSGHERDTTLILRNTGLKRLLRRNNIKFVDFNFDDVVLVDAPNPLTFKKVALPRSIVDADIVISTPKLKTHHWVGVSLGMKNFFGVPPGSLYGCPKNRLHWASYPRVVADLVSIIRPELTFIDGIIGIEGNGPLDGREKRVDIIISGNNVFSTDVTATRIMGFSPYLIPKFWFCSFKNLGNPNPKVVGERIDSVKVPFKAPPNRPWDLLAKRAENLNIKDLLL